MNEITKKAIWHGVKVFVYAGISAVVPVLVAWVTQNPSYLVLAPVINTIWAGVQKYVDENNLLAGKTPQA